MKIDDFSAVPTIKDAFYLHDSMHLHKTVFAVENDNTSLISMIDCTSTKMFGTYDQIKAVYDVTENECPLINIVPPLDRKIYQLLWYTTNIKKGRHSPKIFQVWTSEPDDELFVVHPDQEGVKNNEIRILAASYKIKRPKMLYYDLPENKE